MRSSLLLLHHTGCTTTEAQTVRRTYLRLPLGHGTHGITVEVRLVKARWSRAIGGHLSRDYGNHWSTAVFRDDQTNKRSPPAA